MSSINCRPAFGNPENRKRATAKALGAAKISAAQRGVLARQQTRIAVSPPPVHTLEIKESTSAAAMPVLRAELLGSNRAAALGIEARGPTAPNTVLEAGWAWLRPRYAA